MKRLDKYDFWNMRKKVTHVSLDIRIVSRNGAGLELDQKKVITSCANYSAMIPRGEFHREKRSITSGFRKTRCRQGSEFKRLQPVPACLTFTFSAFYGLRNNQLPPLRKIAHDEASAAMQTATAARAPAAPAPASTTHPVTGNSNFASVGFGPGPAAPPPMPSSSYPTGAAYPGGPGMSRVNVGCSGNGNGGSESVAGNTRKKARMG